MRFRWREHEYDMIDLDHATFGEIEHVEKLLKRKADDWSAIDAVRASYWLSVRRVDHTLLSWLAMTEEAPADFEDITEKGEDEEGDAEEDVDPPAPAPRRAASPRSSRSTGPRSLRPSGSDPGRSGNDSPSPSSQRPASTSTG